MKLVIKPSRIAGTIAVPGSKSHTIRAIVAALAADGESHLIAPLDSADTRSTLNAAAALGATVREAERDWYITGVGGHFRRPAGTLDLGNSGTGMRMLTAMAANADFPVTLDGDASLRTRLMRSELQALEALGVRQSSTEQFKCPLTVHGPIRGGRAKVEGNTSQYLTSLLFAVPLALRDTELVLEYLNEKPYVAITLKWLDRLGIRYEISDDLLSARIPGGQRYPAFEAVIPADFSTAAFPLAAAALCGDGVAIDNLDFSDSQGDKAVFTLFERMGARFRRDNPLFVEPAAEPLTGGDFDLNATPDALPVMAAAAAAARGVTRLLNVPQARIKETDRIACMTRELRKMGAEITELPDGMVITGSRLHGAAVNGRGDHRIVMALAIAALTADGETVIDTAESAAVTYPVFVEDFRRLGADFTLVE